MPIIGEDITRVIGHLINEGDLNSKIRRILEKEIRRRLAEYQLIDMGFQKKYGITLEEFEKRTIIKEKGYSFEVESDYHEWDAAVDATKTLQKDLKELCQRN